jgi:hypothetical protein
MLSPLLLDCVSGGRRRDHKVGYFRAATREAAMAAFRKSWQRE